MDAQNASGIVRTEAEYRPPYDFARILGFFRERSLAGVESIDDSTYMRAARVEDEAGCPAVGWIKVQDDPAHSRLMIEIAPELAQHAEELTERIRRMFDTDCDPAPIERHMNALPDLPVRYRPETRLPGCFDPFETACRAVLGQQISVKAANKLAARMVEAYGTPVDVGMEGLDRVWPSPAALLSLESPEDALGGLGVIRTRAAVIMEIARLMEEGSLPLDGADDVGRQLEMLLSIKGVGPWTAGYIAMRVLAHTDAFLEKDAGVAHALPDLSPSERLKMAQPCRPWRSYLVMALWNSLS